MRFPRSWPLAALVLANLACGGNQPAREAEPPPPLDGGAITVLVNEYGYKPATVQAKAGELLKLVFKRTTDKGCGGEVVFPDHNIKKQLPVGEEVIVELTPKHNEQIAFTCGMGMYEGKVVASGAGG